MYERKCPVAFTPSGLSLVPYTRPPLHAASAPPPLLFPSSCCVHTVVASCISPSLPASRFRSLPFRLLSLHFLSMVRRPPAHNQRRPPSPSAATERWSATAIDNVTRHLQQSANTARRSARVQHDASCPRRARALPALVRPRAVASLRAVHRRMQHGHSLMPYDASGATVAFVRTSVASSPPPPVSAAVPHHAAHSTGSCNIKPQRPLLTVARLSLRVVLRSRRRPRW